MEAIGWYDKPCPFSHPLSMNDIENYMCTLDIYSYRSWMCHSIISDHRMQAIRDAIKGKKCVEVGAGRGLYAYLLEDGIIPTDDYPPEFTFTPVEKITSVEAVLKYAPDILMLVWPLCDTMASDALKVFAGTTVIYIGEPRGGFTADDAFFDMLDESKLVFTDLDLYDTMFIYKC